MPRGRGVRRHGYSNRGMRGRGQSRVGLYFQCNNAAIGFEKCFPGDTNPCSVLCTTSLYATHEEHLPFHFPRPTSARVCTCVHVR